MLPSGLHGQAPLYAVHLPRPGGGRMQVGTSWSPVRTMAGWDWGFFLDSIWAAMLVWVTFLLM